jgi:hypothetical protein
MKIIITMTLIYAFNVYPEVMQAFIFGRQYDAQDLLMKDEMAQSVEC